MSAPGASSTLNVNVFTAPGKTMAGDRTKPFGEPLGFDPITSTLIFGEYDAVLVDAMTTVAEAEALAAWVALHNRNLETIYITHAHTFVMNTKTVAATVTLAAGQASTPQALPARSSSANITRAAPRRRSPYLERHNASL